MADAQGRFKIESLDPTLVFRLAVAAPGFRTKYVSKVDPAAGPVKVSLEPLALAKVGPKNKLVARVVDPQGRPVPNAKVDFDGIYYETGGSSYVAIQGFDHLAVTDAKGEFVLTSEKAFASTGVTVEAHGLARQMYQRLEAGKMHELHLVKGNTVTGRMVGAGKPIANAEIGLAGANRLGGEFIGTFAATTDAAGRFVFPNLPPGKECFIYSHMCEAGANGGVVSWHKFTTGADSTITGLGDLIVQPAFRVSGRVVLSDGKPLPRGIRAMLSRDEAWDQLPNVPVKPDGSFTFDGVPAESVGVSVDVPGYCLSLQNPSLDRLNGLSIVGQVSGNIQGLVILEEPGQFKRDLSGPYKPDDMPRDKPLRGVTPEKLSH